MRPRGWAFLISSLLVIGPAGSHLPRTPAVAGEDEARPAPDGEEKPGDTTSRPSGETEDDPPDAEGSGSDKPADPSPPKPPRNGKRPAWGVGTGRYRVKDRRKVYLGDPLQFRQPATVRLREVFEQILEYRQAKKKSDEEAEYWILLNRAKTKMTKALREVASRHAYDLIAEEGEVIHTDGGQPPPDVTGEVIAAIS